MPFWLLRRVLQALAKKEAASQGLAAASREEHKRSGGGDEGQDDGENKKKGDASHDRHSFPALQMHPRERVTVHAPLAPGAASAQEHTLMRNTSWLVPGERLERTHTPSHVCDTCERACPTWSAPARALPRGRQWM